VSSSAVPGWLSALAARAEDLHDVFPRRIPPPAGGRGAAVLILFGPTGVDDAGVNGAGVDDAGVAVLLTQRSVGLRAHPGQVAFPGGAVDPADASPVAAALREAVEETGLDPAGVDVLGSMPPLFLPPSGFVVTPVLAWWPDPSPVRAVDPQEVARVVRVPLSDLLEPANRFTVQHPSGYAGPGFAVDGLFVWGFTAGLLARVLAEAGLERPWDTSRFEPLPELADPADRSELVAPDTVAGSAGPERGPA
jgi:8-oxo-dGTP pyrophosphatase MutT (NUDIX family)